MELQTYKDLEWELKAPREDNNKKLFTYEQSLERIRKEGGNNARHPYPSEVFSLICDGLENKLSGDLKKVCDNLFSSYCEWFSMAFETKGNILIAYLDPENLKCNGQKYVVNGKKLKYLSKHVFNVKGIFSGQSIGLGHFPDYSIGLGHFPDDFVKFIYSRSFNELPKEMQTGDEMAQIYLPSEGTISPVGRNLFNIVGDYNFGASNWVCKNLTGTRG